jgi:hypothetical protein
VPALHKRYVANMVRRAGSVLLWVKRELSSVICWTLQLCFGWVAAAWGVTCAAGLSQSLAPASCNPHPVVVECKRRAQAQGVDEYI